MVEAAVPAEDPLPDAVAGEDPDETAVVEADAVAVEFVPAAEAEVEPLELLATALSAEPLAMISFFTSLDSPLEPAFVTPAVVDTMFR